MNMDDLHVALSFLDVRDNIIIECATHRDVPYIKRELQNVLGTPDRTIGNTWKYGKKTITILPVLYAHDDNTRGYRVEDLFYVPWISGEDLWMAKERGVVHDDSPMILTTWLEANMSIPDMYYGLLVDGYTKRDAVRYLSVFANRLGLEG